MRASLLHYYTFCQPLLQNQPQKKLAKPDLKNDKSLSKYANSGARRGKIEVFVKIKILEFADFFRFQNAIRA